MKRRGRRDPELEARWRGQVADWQASGQGIREFCKERGLAESSFHAWRRELLRRDGVSGQPAVKKVEATCRAASAFAAVRMDRGGDTAFRQSAAIEIILGDATVRVSAGVDVTMLSDVLELLRRG